MGDIHGFQRRVDRAMQQLNRAAIAEEDRALIKDFVRYKTVSENLKLAGQEGYLQFLRLIAERYLDGRTYASLTREDVMEVVAKLERSHLSARMQEFNFSKKPSP